MSADPTLVAEFRARATYVNDARLDGRMSRADWSGAVEDISADLAAVGLTWDDLQ